MRRLKVNILKMLIFYTLIEFKLTNINKKNHMILIYLKKKSNEFFISY